MNTRFRSGLHRVNIGYDLGGGEELVVEDEDSVFETIGWFVCSELEDGTETDWGKSDWTEFESWTGSDWGRSESDWTEGIGDWIGGIGDWTRVADWNEEEELPIDVFVCKGDTGGWLVAMIGIEEKLKLVGDEEDWLREGDDSNKSAHGNLRLIKKNTFRNINSARRRQTFISLMRGRISQEKTLMRSKIQFMIVVRSK